MTLAFLKKSRNLSVLIWIFLCVSAITRFASISGDRTFQYDEWNFVLNRWQLSLDTFLQPHNIHLSVFPAAIFFVLLRAIGLADYSVFLFVGFATHIVTTSAFAFLIYKRLGKICSIALGALLLFLGTGAENTLWPFQIGAMASLAGYLLALHFLESNLKNARFMAMAAIVLSLGSAGFGIAAVIGISVQIALSKQITKSWWVAVGPSAIWVLWYLNYGQSEVKSENLDLALRYINESFAASLNLIFALSIGWGFIFEVVLSGALAYFVFVKKSLKPKTVWNSCNVMRKLVFYGTLTRPILGASIKSLCLFDDSADSSRCSRNCQKTSTGTVECGSNHYFALVNHRQLVVHECSCSIFA
jgi:hypothetical protein